MTLQERLEKAKKLKRFDKKDYAEVIKKHPGASCFEFGCPDWEHDEEGKLNAWAVLALKKEEWGDPEDLENRVPFEQQHYQIEKEIVLWDNYQVGWSRMVDQGLVNDYWKEYDLWN